MCVDIQTPCTHTHAHAQAHTYKYYDYGHRIPHQQKKFELNLELKLLCMKKSFKTSTSILICLHQQIAKENRASIDHRY